MKRGVFATWLYMVTQIPANMAQIPTKMAWRDKNLCGHDRQVNRKNIRHKGVNDPPPLFPFSEFCAKPHGVTFRRFAPPPPPA